MAWTMSFCRRLNGSSRLTPRTIITYLSNPVPTGASAIRLIFTSSRSHALLILCGSSGHCRGLQAVWGWICCTAQAILHRFSPISRWCLHFTTSSSLNRVTRTTSRSIRIWGGSTVGLLCRASWASAARLSPSPTMSTRISCASSTFRARGCR